MSNTPKTNRKAHRSNANQKEYIGSGYEDTPHRERVKLLKRALTEMIKDRRLTLLEIQAAVAALSEMES